MTESEWKEEAIKKQSLKALEVERVWKAVRREQAAVLADLQGAVAAQGVKNIGKVA